MVFSPTFDENRTHLNRGGVQLNSAPNKSPQFGQRHLRHGNCNLKGNAGDDHGPATFFPFGERE